MIPVTLSAQTVAEPRPAAPGDRVIMDTLTVLAGEGVRGRVDTLDVRTGAIGPEDAKAFTLVRPRGTNLTFSFAADTGFTDLTIVAETDPVASNGTIVIRGNLVVLVGADRRIVLKDAP